MMFHQHRVTKYDPRMRDRTGRFAGEDWTSVHDVGRTFGGTVFSEQAYLAVEDAYVRAIRLFLDDLGLTEMHVTGIEMPDPAGALDGVAEGMALPVARCADLARAILRETIWARLEAPGAAFVHFGYDFYMYFGADRPYDRALQGISALGLFAEPCRSPYLQGD